MPPVEYLWSALLSLVSFLLWFVIRGAHTRIDKSNERHDKAWEIFLGHITKIEERHAATIDRISNKVSETREFVAANYVPREELGERLDGVVQTLEKLRSDLHSYMASGRVGRQAYAKTP